MEMRMSVVSVQMIKYCPRIDGVRQVFFKVLSFVYVIGLLMDVVER